MLKFQVDDVWSDRCDCPYLVVEIQGGNFPVVAMDLRSGSAILLTATGKEINNTIDSPQDLVTYLGTKKDFPEYDL